MIYSGKLIICLCLFLLEIFSHRPTCEGIPLRDPDTLERFISEAPAAWKRAREARAAYASPGKIETARLTKRWEKTKQRERETELVEVTTNFDDNHLTYFRKESGYEDKLIIVNPQYGCDLGRTTTQSGWSLVEVVPAKGDPDGTQPTPNGYILRKKFPGPRSHGLQNCTVVYAPDPNLRLDEIPEFDLQNASEVSHKGRNMVRIEFRLPFEMYVSNESTNNRPEKQQLTGDSYAIFDPDENWAVVEFSFQYGELFKHYATYEYSRLDTGVAYRSKELNERFYKGDKLSSTLVETTVKRVPVKLQDFTLTHYGFPEPDFYKPPRPWWMYVSITGMIIMVIGAVVLHFGRRMRRG